MSKLNRYLVVSELKGFGYIVGNYRSLKEARRIRDMLIDKYELFRKGLNNKLYEESINVRRYNIHPTVVANYVPIQNALENTTNGIYSVAIVITGVDGFSIKQLILYRGNTVFAYNLEDIKEGKRFTPWCPNFIAN